MRVLLAFDKFKDCLTAQEACTAAVAAIRANHADWIVDSAPLADGGEGFATILTESAVGRLQTEEVTGPRGKRVRARYGLVPAATVPAAARLQLALDSTEGQIAVIEMAAASGLALLGADERDVWSTATTGTGELMQRAAAAQAAAIILGVGGSATNDLGLGALTALGLELRDATGAPVAPPAPAAWPRVESLGGTLAPLPPIFIACDVDNPLLGPRGAAAVYGPQKGLRPADVARLDAEVCRMAQRLCARFRQPESVMDAPGAGAAGGIAFGLMVATRARLLPGFDFVSRWLDLDARIDRADIVVTGEGRFDESSSSGKGPGAIAACALARGKRVHVFAGAVTARENRPGLFLHPVTPAGTPLDVALRSARENLSRAVRETFG